MDIIGQNNWNMKNTVLIKILCAFLMCIGAFGSVSAQEILRCNMNHPGGDREQGVMSISSAGAITGFTWLYARKAGGSCDIQANTFQVVRADLMVGRNGCHLMTWRQGSNITLAFSPATPQCQSYCTKKGAYEALLPVSFDQNSRGCRI